MKFGIFLPLAFARVVSADACRCVEDVLREERDQPRDQIDPFCREIKYLHQELERQSAWIELAREKTSALVDAIERMAFEPQNRPSDAEIIELMAAGI